MAQQSHEFPEALTELQERMGPQIEQLKETLDDLNRKALRMMREHPGACVLGAVAAGFLLGRMVSRR